MDATFHWPSSRSKIWFEEVAELLRFMNLMSMFNFSNASLSTV
jgi:hypothetical protein